MKKEKSQKNEHKETDIQGDKVIRHTNQVPFLCVPVKDPFEKQKTPAYSEKSLYRVIKLK